MRFTYNAPVPDRLAEKGTSIPTLADNELVPHIVEARPIEADIPAERVDIPARVAERVARSPREDENAPAHDRLAEIAPPIVSDADNPLVPLIEVVEDISPPVFGGSIKEYVSCVAVGNAEYFTLSQSPV